MTTRLDPQFRPLLRGFDIDALDREPSAIYGLWHDGRIAYTNPAWTQFAERNGGAALTERWSLGASVWTALPAVFVDFYRDAYRSVLTDGQVWQHIYLCSSSTLHRQFQQIAFPLPERAGLLIVNSLVIEELCNEERHAPDDAVYRSAHGLINQCAHCRRVKRIGSGTDAAWDWVPDWIDAPPEGISHGICAPCRGHYFPRP